VAMLYHQQYCGCVFSEYDRFKDTRLHLWPVPENPARD
jgi:predicted adenine nucleotide alpha hydrolase (AANH) superfamily ATPase